MSRRETGDVTLTVASPNSQPDEAERLEGDAGQPEVAHLLRHVPRRLQVLRAAGDHLAEKRVVERREAVGQVVGVVLADRRHQGLLAGRQVRLGRRRRPSPRRKDKHHQQGCDDDRERQCESWSHGSPLAGPRRRAGGQDASLTQPTTALTVTPPACAQGQGRGACSRLAPARRRRPQPGISRTSPPHAEPFRARKALPELTTRRGVTRSTARARSALPDQNVTCTGVTGSLTPAGRGGTMMASSPAGLRLPGPPGVAIPGAFSFRRPMSTSVRFLVDGFNLYHVDRERLITTAASTADGSTSAPCASPCCTPSDGGAEVAQVDYFSALAHHLESSRPGTVARHERYIESSAHHRCHPAPRRLQAQGQSATTRGRARYSSGGTKRRRPTSRSPRRSSKQRVGGTALLSCSCRATRTCCRHSRRLADYDPNCDSSASSRPTGPTVRSGRMSRPTSRSAPGSSPNTFWQTL